MRMAVVIVCSAFDTLLRPAPLFLEDLHEAVLIAEVLSVLPYQLQPVKNYNWYTDEQEKTLLLSIKLTLNWYQIDQ